MIRTDGEYGDDVFGDDEHHHDIGHEYNAAPEKSGAAFDLACRGAVL